MSLAYFAVHHAQVQELLYCTDEMPLVVACQGNRMEWAFKIIPGTIPGMKWHFMALFPDSTYKPIDCHDFSVKPLGTGK